MPHSKFVFNVNTLLMKEQQHPKDKLATHVEMFLNA
jgi:hypothetical protein